MKRILFVDAENNVLDGLRRMLHSRRTEWDVRFASSAPEAMAILAIERFDIIVSDTRMPGVDGSELLCLVLKQYPHMIRVVLSGSIDRRGALGTVGLAHRYISKPCDPDTLLNAITRSLELREILSSDALRAIVCKIESIPSLPKLYQEVNAKLADADASLDEIAALISRDPGMTARILQLANSAFFAHNRSITEVNRAIGFIGLDTIRALVTTTQVFSQFTQANIDHLGLETLFDHSLTVGKYAQIIARGEKCSRGTLDDVLVASLLHDAGKLVLAANLAREYAECVLETRRTGKPIRLLELEAFGATHAEVGGYLLGIWGLPGRIVDTIAFHHEPGKCVAGDVMILTSVHVADAFAHEFTGSSENEWPMLDLDYLSAAGYSGHIEKWRDACLSAV